MTTAAERTGRLAWIRGGTREDGDAWKEWVHAVVLTPGLDVIANVSLLGSIATGAAARVIGLVRGDGWTGGVERIAPSSVAVGAGGRGLRAGSSEVRWDGSAWHMTVDLPGERLHLQLALTPIATPASVMRLPFGADAPVQWNVVPHASASGTVTVDGRVTILDRAPAYVDHNHGRFAWGEDFVWEWGAFLPEPGAHPTLGAAVFSRLLDARRHRVRAAGLMTWADQRYDRFYGDHTTTFALEGRWKGARPRTFPPEMSAALEAGVVGVPARVEVVGALPDQRDTVRMHVTHAARLAVPSDHDPTGTVVVWELTGPAERIARRHGGEARVAGRGIVELVRVR